MQRVWNDYRWKPVTQTGLGALVAPGIGQTTSRTTPTMMFVGGVLIGSIIGLIIYEIRYFGK